MIWWYWMLLGLVLLGAEMVTPGGFYILFFGLAALIVGSCDRPGVRPGGMAPVAACFQDLQFCHCWSFADRCWPGSKPRRSRTCRP